MNNKIDVESTMVVGYQVCIEQNMCRIKQLFLALVCTCLAKLCVIRETHINYNNIFVLFVNGTVHIRESE